MAETPDNWQSDGISNAGPAAGSLAPDHPRRRPGQASISVADGQAHPAAAASPWDSPAAIKASGAKRKSTRNNPKTAPARIPNLAGNQGAGALTRIFDTPKKLLIALAITLLVLVLSGFYSCDGIMNFGRIHRGVTVGGIDIGRMQESEAAEKITTELTAAAMSAPVILFASESAAAAGVNANTVELGSGVSDGLTTAVDTSATSWSIGLGTLSAEVDGYRLAEQAYGVGRGSDFLFGRLAASAFGVNITPQISFSEDRLSYLEATLTEAIGKPMINASVSFDGTHFVVTDGQDGRVVDEEPFERLLHQAFFSEQREIIVPMVDRAMRVNRQDAEAEAQNAQEAISKPITLTYADNYWSLEPEQLGSLVNFTVLLERPGHWNLVPSIDIVKLQALTLEIIGEIEITDQIMPLDAEFVEIDGVLQIVPSQNGTGVDYPRLARDIAALLFGTDTLSEGVDAQARLVPIMIGVLNPKLMTSDAEAYDFRTKISEYTCYYPYIPSESVTNIHNAARLCNSSIIGPYEEWSLLDTVGDITAENGFVISQVIDSGHYTEGIGGGVCTVATTVFNAVWEAGYPIVERVQHTLRAERYPLGRDAAIAAPYADFQFENDTENYLLLTISFTDDSITATLWGISPGYVVETIMGEFVEGEDFETIEIEDPTLAPGHSYVDTEGLRASTVDVTRIVYDADGNIRLKKTFYSSYAATPMIIKIAPK